MKMHLVIRYALAALLLLGATSSHAANSWRYQDLNGYWNGTYEATPELACSNNFLVGSSSAHRFTHGGAQFSSVTNYSGENYNCNCVDNVDSYACGKAISRTNCPSGWDSDGSGGCIDPSVPVYTCTPDKVISAVVQRDQSGSFPTEICAEQSHATGDFCMYGGIGELVITDLNQTTKLYRAASAEQGTVSCDTQDVEIVEIVRLPFDPSSYTGELLANDSIFTSTSETYSPPNTVCVTNGNGTDTCVTVQTESITTTANQGTTTTTDGNTITQTVDGGTTISSTKTTSTTDDGQGTVTEQVDRTNTSHIGIKSTLVAGDYNFSTSGTAQTESKTTTTTTTTTTNPDGSVTVAETTKTEEGAPEEPGDADTPGSCGAPGQPACEISLEGEDSLSDPNATFDDSGIIGILDTFKQQIDDTEQEDISGALLNMTPIQINSGGSCNPLTYSATYHGESWLPLDEFCTLYDSDIRPALAYLIYGLTLIGLYRVYVRGIRGGS